MPIKIRKIRNQDLYTVKDSDGRVFAKGTTKEKAEKQKFAIERSVNQQNVIRAIKAKKKRKKIVRKK